MFVEECSCRHVLTPRRIDVPVQEEPLYCDKPTNCMKHVNTSMIVRYHEEEYGKENISTVFEFHPLTGDNATHHLHYEALL